MVGDFFFIFLATLYLYSLNFFQIKYKICLDKISINEKHKSLANINNTTPLSGSFFFIPIFIFLFYKSDPLFLIFSGFIFCIGLLSDLKQLSSPKVRLFIQLILISIFVILNKNIIIDFRSEYINNFFQSNFARIFIVSFLFLVLINGFNFIDGVNTLSSLNIFIVLIFYQLLYYDFETAINDKIFILSLCILIFITFNFFGKNFLGDGAIYGLSFALGYFLVSLSITYENISPYYIANLLWYPAFENLFTIIRRLIGRKKNYLADNNHLHQIIFKFITKYKISNNKVFVSSITGFLINFYLIFSYYVGYLFYSKTNIQVFIIIINITVYVLVYNFLKKIIF